MQDSSHDAPNKWLLLANQLVLWALIIAYCVLSQSLFSTIALIFLVVSLTLTIAKPYKLAPQPLERVPARERRVSNGPVERIEWALFSCLNIAFLGAKVVIYFGFSSGMTEEEQSFLEVQSLVNVFVPMIIIPFSFFAAFTPPSALTLLDFKKKLNPFLPLPLYLILCLLILLIQIFSVSLMGLLYFFIMIYLFWMKSFSFRDHYFKPMLILVQVTTTVTIFLTFLTTSPLLLTPSLMEVYQFIGINSLNDFSGSPLSQGHFICEILLSLMTALLNRLFIYQSLNSIFLLQYSPSIDISALPQVEGAQEEGEGSPSRRSLRERLIPHRASDQVPPFKQQMEMRDLTERESFHSDNHEEHHHNHRPTEQKEKMFLQEVLAFEEEPVDETEEEKSRLRRQKIEGSINWKQVRRNFLATITSIFHFLNSPQFSLRVIEVLSIIVIQRYNNVYSLVNLIWLAFVSSVQNLLWVRIFTATVILPLEVCNFVITYFYNIPHSPATDVTGAQIYGFQYSSAIWVDVIIFNLYLNYLVLFVKSYYLIKESAEKKVKRQRRRPKTWEVILAFIFRYTYLLTLVGLFFLGFSNPTVINLIYISLFLIFFSNGDKLMFIVRERGRRKRTTLTTFSKHYWYVIVYYTLLIIIGKYLYFLFFNGEATGWLEPTGLNQIYDWSFNFSLSSYCPSNTTPFFIIFVLAELQIIIYRSYIYTNYSFSIMADFVDGTARKAVSMKSRMKRKFIQLVVVANELYYQSIYYISGFIIIGCSYRWSFIGLAIIALTCVGLLSSFTKKLLGSILVLNLLFLFLNYLVLLINEYASISDAIGQGFIDQINDISLFIGFSLAKDSYTSLFVLNIVIFYFCVICYALSSILETREFDEVQLSNSSASSSRSSPEDHREFREPTVVDSEYDDNRFAETYRRDVIESTRRFYNQNLVRKYGWVRGCGNLLRMLLTDLVAIFVIIECLYFRLSVSMFLFLLVYLVYYFTLFDNIGSVYASSNFSSKVEEQLDLFSLKEKLLEQTEPLESLLGDQKEVEAAESFMKFKADNIQMIKNDARRQIWRYSAFLSVSCILLTYASQFLISDFYTTKVSFSGTDKIEIVLFLLGVNSGTDFGDYVYFYYVMLIINIIEKLTIVFSERMMHHQHEVKESQAGNDIKELPKLENPFYLINHSVDEDFILEIEGEELMGAPEVSVGVVVGGEGGCVKEANLLIYFQFKMVVIRLNMLYGGIHFMIRFYLWLMLINLYSKSNVFAIAYFVAVLCFWFREVNFGLIRDINKAAIIILLLQYFVLLLDVNTTTSPLPLPTSDNLSLLEQFIDNPAWVDFLAVSSNDDNNNSYLGSFLINSIIIFFTELCFTIYQNIAQLVVRSILALYRKYESVLQKLQEQEGDEGAEQIEVNLLAYKSWYHRMGVFLYQNLIMNSYLIVSLLMFMLLSGVHNFLALFLLSIAFLYIYLGIFTRLSEREDIFNYTRIFFRVFNVLQLLILLTGIILNMPFVPTTDFLNQIRALSSIEQIILILFIQVWIDLNASRSFKSMAEEYRSQNLKKRAVALRCITFQRNNYLISSMVREFKEILSFDTNIAEAMQIIKSWHASTKRQNNTIDYDFGSMQEKDSTRQIRKEIEEEHIGDDHKSFADVIHQICQTQTDVALAFDYYDTLRYVTQNIGGLTAYHKLRLTAWSFIKEDYQVVEQLLTEFDEQIRLAADSIVQNDSDAIAEVLAEVKVEVGWVGAEGEVRDRDTPPKIIQEEISAKLAIRPESFHQREKGKVQLVALLLSNLEVLIVLLIEIYYCVNPCLLSLPLIAFAFSYYVIASRKLTFLLLAYVFILIFTGEVVQILDLPSDPDSMAVLKFFYFVDEDGSVYYALGYLYFIFVVIFLQQEVIRFRGNKFRDCEEVENLEKAFLRVLINQDESSKLYLWKYSEVEHQFLQNINPFNIAAYEIENNLERLFSNDTSFLAIFSDRKIGADFYPPIAAVQIFLTIYLIFFYPLMTDVNGYTLQETTKYYQFSSDMVIGVLVHVANIVIQRYITIRVTSRRNKVISKYIYTLIIFCLFSWFVFYLAPYKASLTLSASFYSPTPALIAFSFYYFIYFYLSALQVKYGFKEFKPINSLMTRRGYANYYLVSAYTAIPFLYEVKMIMDWTFSETSLTLNDWSRQFSIYLSSFTSKINYYSATTTTVLGQTIPWYYKIIGWAGFIGILLIIFGPMVLFSGLNPIAETNLVVSGSMVLSLQIQNGNSFTFYQTSHFSNPPVTYNEDMFDQQGFNNVTVLQQMTSSDISQQFQSITYEPVGDSNWGITQPNYAQIVENVNRSINDMMANNTPTYQFQLVASYIMNRQVAATIATGTTFTYPSQSSFLSLAQLKSVYQTLTTCNSPTYLPSFYISLIRLNTQGNTYKPRPIIYYNSSKITGLPQQPYLFNVTLNLFCEQGTINTTNTNDVYWGLYLDNTTTPLPSNASINSTQGLTLYVYCDKYQNIIGGYGFTALYTSIILVIAGFVRTMFDGNLPLISYQLNPKPDNILQICEAINTLRVRKQFRQQYLMYYELIDIIRSPQIMKHLSGSYPYLIEEAHEKSLRAQEEKEMEKQKTL